MCGGQGCWYGRVAGWQRNETGLFTILLCLHFIVLLLSLFDWMVLFLLFLQFLTLDWMFLFLLCLLLIAILHVFLPPIPLPHIVSILLRDVVSSTPLLSCFLPLLSVPG